MKVKLVLRSDNKVAVEDIPVKVTCSDPAGRTEESQRGLVDFGAVAQGKYKITTAFSDPDQNRYDFFEPDGKQIEVVQGKDEPILLELVPLYTKVVFIGHCLPTIAKQLWDEAKKEWKAQYNGLATEGLDIDKRVRFLRDVIAKARAEVVQKEDELKVFVVPECFFLGRNGAYTVESLSSLVEKLQNLVKGPEWKHWVFAFGTVNGAYEDAGKFMELFNVAPVIRGGFEALDKAPDYTRLIQKATFSQELPSKAELKVGFADTPFTSEDFRYGFGATEYEYVYGRLVSELLADPGPSIGGTALDAVFVAQGLGAAGAWETLRKKVEGEVTARGMTCVVRDLREGVAKDWVAPFKSMLERYAKSDGRTVDPTVLGKKTGRNFIPDDFAFRCARKPGPWLDKTDLPRKRKLTFALEICADHAEGRFKNAQEIAHREAEKKKVAASAAWRADEEKKKRLVKLKKETQERQEELKAANLSVSAKSDIEKALREMETEMNDLKDIDAHSVMTKQEMDEATRLLEAEVRKRDEIDIQLVPSAGMILQPPLAARAGGFAFNCDGWNADKSRKPVIEKRGGQIRIYKNARWPEDSGHNPLLPHSELLKAPAIAVKCRVVSLEREDADGIFGEGPGELHIYPTQALPD